ncbi:MAG TPA: SDR family NAD(P)-dependent oxidoreductase [Opitutaceae bacterium]|nr:SDR family NAD(P)-dependent oxidoreductase [Opitutaceae bacterium]HND61479.1 SDR family NAD(P)-dependent oxidoreductase [Opitutaceae bacterium]
MPLHIGTLEKYSTVIVTGGSSGIGKSFIERAAKLKPELHFCNLSRRVPDTKKSGINLNHFGCDLSRPADLERAAAKVTEFLAQSAPPGRVLLVNNSGFGGYGHFPAPSLGHQLEMLDVNVRAVVHLTGLLLPAIRERGGAIINVASTAAFQPTAYMATYGASKAFVLHWSLALHEELRGSGVQTLAVCPGPTATDFFRRAGMQSGTVSPSLSMSADEVVDAAFRALAAGRSQVVTGWKNRLGAGLITKLPKPLAARAAAKVLARYRLKQVQR